MHFHKQNFILKYHNITIKPVDDMKILGIKFANHRNKNKLNFNMHI